MPTRRCLKVGCSKPQTGRGYCDEHRAERSRQTRSPFHSFYRSKGWEMSRRKQLHDEPLCELQHPGCLTLATEVHHKVALAAGGAPRRPENLASACKPCHSRETRAEQLAGPRGGSKPSVQNDAGPPEADARTNQTAGA